jgi:hypothetical protein
MRKLIVLLALTLMVGASAAQAVEGTADVRCTIDYSFDKGLANIDTRPFMWTAAAVWHPNKTAVNIGLGLTQTLAQAIASCETTALKHRPANGLPVNVVWQYNVDLPD